MLLVGYDTSYKGFGLNFRSCKDFLSPLYDHHIFPKPRKAGYKKSDPANSVLNRTLLDGSTNRDYIRNKKPADYLKKIIADQSITESTLRKRLESHLISRKAYDCLVRDDFDGFVEARKARICEVLKRLIMPVQTTDQNDIGGLLHGRESKKLEYKSSMRWDMKLNRPNPALGETIAKELCAFMNTDGGDLLIGVDDDGNVVGLEKDYSTFHGKRSDGFSQHLTNLVNKHLGKNANEYLELDFVTVGNDEVCRCRIRPARGKKSSPIFFAKDDEKKFYIRANNTCQPLDMEEAYRYISEKWG